MLWAPKREMRLTFFASKLNQPMATLGDWIKHVVEMVAHIDARKSRQMESYFNDDALRRTGRIAF